VRTPFVSIHFVNGLLIRFLRLSVGSHDLYLSSPYFVTPQNHEDRLRAVYEMIVDEVSFLEPA
jgi:hypothetical protein